MMVAGNKTAETREIKIIQPPLRSVLFVASVAIVKLTSDTQVRGPSYGGASELWRPER